MWMNEYEIEDAWMRFRTDETPNLRKGARVLFRLMAWTNSHSDGWGYWQKPGRAAAKLMDLLHDAVLRIRRDDIEDITDAELTKALSPIKAFLTRQGVDHDLILKEPVKPMPKFTVIGYWKTDDTRHVIGVIAGEHQVTGGVEPNDRGLFAEVVEAETAEAAEAMVHGTTEYEEEDVV